MPALRTGRAPALLYRGVAMSITYNGTIRVRVDVDIDIIDAPDLEAAEDLALETVSRAIEEAGGDITSMRIVYSMEDIHDGHHN